MCFGLFGDDYLMIIDESLSPFPNPGHVQRRLQRKQTLVDYGFRLPSALDNRPLNFEEFEAKIHQVIFTSATPGDYELSKSYQVVEQIIRPTGLLDPLIEVRPTENQIDHLLKDLKEQIRRNERTLITTLTIKMSEDLTSYKRSRYQSGLSPFGNHGLNIRNHPQAPPGVLIVWINFSGRFDIPEVSLIVILICEFPIRTVAHQTITGCAVNGQSCYADKYLMYKAIEETYRRRRIQKIQSGAGTTCDIQRYS